MGSFFAELRRRHIYRIGGIYVVVAWGITQVLDVLSQMFALPDWIAQPSLVVLTIGFPVVLIAAWTIVGAAKSSDTLAELKRATATDWALLGALIVVIGLIGYQQFASPTVVVVDTRATAAAEDIIAEVADRMPNSVAVLPFENQSLEPENAFFASGVHDEILSKLSKLQNLTVIARASVMRYEDSDLPIPDIAEELNVEMVMAGTVRYAGDQVRVTAQLIDGMTNVPVWTTEDEGELSDIFGIQSDIAMNIANSLQAQFSSEEQESIEAIPTNSTEAYALYLQARGLWLNSSAGDLSTRLIVHDILDQALELDPNFALALAHKGMMYEQSRTFDLVTEEDWPAFKMEMEQLALDHADRALALDSTVGLARTVRTFLYLDNLQVDLAVLEAKEALRLLPNDPEVLFLNGIVERDHLGQLEEAVAHFQRAVSLDPYESQWRTELGQALTAAGMYSEAIEEFERCAELAPTRTNCRYNIAVPKFLLGDNQGTLAALRLAEQLGGIDSANSLTWVTYGYGQLGQFDDAQRTFNALEALADVQYIDPPQWARARMGIGDYDEAFRLVNIAIENPQRIRRPAALTDIRLNKWSDPALEEPEWLEVREKLVFN